MDLYAQLSHSTVQNPDHPSTYDPRVQDSQGNSTIDPQTLSWYVIRPIILFMLFFYHNNPNQTLTSFLDFPNVAHCECTKHHTTDPSKRIWYELSKPGWPILIYWAGGQIDGRSFSRWCPAAHTPYPDEDIHPQLQEGDMMCIFSFIFL